MFGTVLEGKTYLKVELHKTDIDIWSRFRNGKALPYKQRNMVVVVLLFYFHGKQLRS